MLVNFNNLSSVRLQQMSERFLHHTRTLVEMKRDLDSIFRRIRWVLGPAGLCLPLQALLPPFSKRATQVFHVTCQQGEIQLIYFMRLLHMLSIQKHPNSGIKIKFLNLNFIYLLKNAT